MLREKFLNRNWRRGREGEGREDGSIVDNVISGGISEVSNTSIHSLLLTGSVNTGKTSFLYSLACEYAQQSNRPYSIIMTQRQALDEKFPLFIHIDTANSEPPHFTDTPPPKDCQFREYFRYIQLSYNENITDLMRNISSLQFFPHHPSILLIDNLSHMIDPTTRLSRTSPEFLDHVCRILSHVYDACSSCGCQDLVITDDCEVPEYIHLLRQFITRHIRCRFGVRKNSLSPHSVEFHLISASPSIFLGKTVLAHEILEMTFSES